jgi:hypothetical protein
MTKLMNRTEIKEEAQRLLLNDGAGAFLHLNEDVMERLEKQVEMFGQALTDENEMELKNAQAVIAEMDTQFERMKKFFLFEGFQSTH